MPENRKHSWNIPERSDISSTTLSCEKHSWEKPKKGAAIRFPQIAHAMAHETKNKVNKWITSNFLFQLHTLDDKWTLSTLESCVKIKAASRAHISVQAHKSIRRHSARTDFKGLVVFAMDRWKSLRVLASNTFSPELRSHQVTAYRRDWNKISLDSRQIQKNLRKVMRVSQFGWKYPPFTQKLAFPTEAALPKYFDSPWIVSTNSASPVLRLAIFVSKNDGIWPGSNPVILGILNRWFDFS